MHYAEIEERLIETIEWADSVIRAQLPAMGEMLKDWESSRERAHRTRATALLALIELRKSASIPRTPPSSPLQILE
jgi:hypothetical protein